MALRVKETKTNVDERKLGLEAYTAKRWLEAIAHLTKALDLNPDDAEVMNALALSHNAVGDKKSAHSILRKAIDSLPESVEAYLNLADLLAGDGRYLEAADVLCSAIEANVSGGSLFRRLEEVRSGVKSLKPAKSGKKGRPTNGPTQADIDSRLMRINASLRKAALKDDQKGDSDQPGLTVCMIVRDEETVLRECLRSVKGLADQIVVVDTGSKDRTSIVAKSMGAEVYSFQWTESFSDARNEALSHAAGSWVLTLDADERLDLAAKDLILNAIADPSIDAYELPIYNYSSDKADADFTVHRNCRLFRNNHRYHYSGRVHERIVPSVEASNGRIGRVDAVIDHYGYTPEAIREKNKNERYISLLMAELKQNPDDLYYLHHLGAAYYASGDYEKALVYIRQAAEVVSAEHEFAGAIFSRLSNVLCKLGRPEDALQAVAEAEGRGIVHPEVNFCRGNALLLLKRYDEAVTEFEMAIGLGKNGIWDGDSSACGYKAEYGLASAYMGLGRLDRAIRIAESALRVKPDDADTLALLAKANLQMGDAAKAEELLQQLSRLNPDDQKVNMELGDVYYHQHRFNAAVSRYKAIIESGNESAELRVRIGACMALLDDLSGAQEQYLRALELKEDYAEAYSDLGSIYVRENRLDEALVCFARSVEVDPTYANGYFNAADLLYSAERYQEASDVYQSGLSHSPRNAAGFLSLGNCYFQMGIYNAAVMAYRQALSLKPGYYEAQNNLSMAEEAMTQQQQAA